MNDANLLKRAARAQEALDNDLIKEALSAWETEITEAWKNSPLRDAEGREKLRLMLEAAKNFRLHLSKTMETGQIIRARQPSFVERAKSVALGRL